MQSTIFDEYIAIPNHPRFLVEASELHNDTKNNDHSNKIIMKTMTMAGWLAS